MEADLKCLAVSLSRRPAIPMQSWHAKVLKNTGDQVTSQHRTPEAELINILRLERLFLKLAL
jgi:hypothetical protein